MPVFKSIIQRESRQLKQKINSKKYITKILLPINKYGWPCLYRQNLNSISVKTIFTNYTFGHFLIFKTFYYEIVMSKLVRIDEPVDAITIKLTTLNMSYTLRVVNFMMIHTCTRLLQMFAETWD